MTSNATDQVCMEKISRFLSINEQRDIFCNFPQLFTCDYHEKLRAGKVLLQYVLRPQVMSLELELDPPTTDQQR